MRQDTADVVSSVPRVTSVPGAANSDNAATKRLLILDDDKLFAESLGWSLRLRLPWCDVVVTSDPTEALGLIDDLTIDLLITDLHLGVANCITLLNEMASYPDTLALPKVILSASGDRLDMADLRQYGVSAIYDKKTYNFADLVQAIRRLLGDGN